MALYKIAPEHKNKTKKRVGRGGKRGTYSGRGVKGQKSRAGRRIRPAVRDLIQQIPKLRGAKNKAAKVKSKRARKGATRKPEVKSDVKETS